MYKVVISGYYGYDNLGDEAVLQGIISSLRKEAEEEIEFTVFSASPRETEERYGVRAAGRFNLFSLFSGLISCDLFISGGGSLLQDTTGWKTVPYYLTLLFFAHLLGVKTAVYAQGVGPLEGRVARFLVGWVLKRVDLVTVRDQGSRELLAELGISRERIEVTVDPVFALQPVCWKREEEQKPLIGVAVRPWGDNNYLSELAGALDSFLAMTGGHCLLVPLQLEKDLATCRRLGELMEYDAEIYEKQLTPGEAMAFFARFDFFIGVRLHSLIFSALQGVPFFALSYDPKVEAFVGELGFENWLSLSECVTALLKEKLQLVWKKRVEIEDRLNEVRPDYRQEAARNACRVLKLLK